MCVYVFYRIRYVLLHLMLYKTAYPHLLPSGNIYNLCCKYPKSLVVGVWSLQCF